ncbi:MAG: hypothetical protein R3E01_06855 [Pirellulaceae bacterium]|nr:hypothetical protein [Planctomycetales bacterium]
MASKTGRWAICQLPTITSGLGLKVIASFYAQPEMTQVYFQFLLFFSGLTAYTTLP